MIGGTAGNDSRDQAGKISMRHLLIRDDDVNALTPPGYLERLHRPWLDRGWPVNLAVIPKVYTDLCMPGGRAEGFLVAKQGQPRKSLAIGANTELTGYLRSHCGYHIALHGYHHSENEFAMIEGIKPYSHWQDVIHRLEKGGQLLRDAGLPEPVAFVPPYNKLSRVSLDELARRFRVVSATRFKFKVVPHRWTLPFAWHRLARRPHWRVGRTRFLTHPPSPLQPGTDADTLVKAVEQLIARQRLTVLAMRWWEFFPNNQPHERFITAYHALAEWLAGRRDIKVVTFAEVAAGCCG